MQTKHILKKKPKQPKNGTSNAFGRRMKSRATGDSVQKSQELQKLKTQLQTDLFQYQNAPNASLGIEIDSIQQKIASLEKKSNVDGTDYQTLISDLQTQINGWQDNINTAQGQITTDSNNILSLTSDPIYQAINNILVNWEHCSGGKLPNGWVQFSSPGIAMTNPNVTCGWAMLAVNEPGTGTYIMGATGNGYLTAGEARIGDTLYYTTKQNLINGYQDDITTQTANIKSWNGQISDATTKLNKYTGAAQELANSQITTEANATSAEVTAQGANIKQQDIGQAAINTATGNSNSNMAIVVVVGVIILGSLFFYFHKAPVKA